MRIKATIEELKTYAKIHQDYVLQSKPDIVLDVFEREVQFDPSNKEHMAATGSFNQFLAFKRQQTGAIADLSGLKLEELTLSQCDLSGIILTGSTILGCVFSNSILRGVDLTQATVKENLFASATIDTARVFGEVCGHPRP